MSTLNIIAFTILIFIFSFSGVIACGHETDCKIGDRTYRIFVPESFDSNSEAGALIHLHGYRGTAKGVMRNKALTSLVSNFNIPLIAPKSKGRDWNFPNSPSYTRSPTNNESKFFDELIEDVVSRFGISPDKLIISGFSSGGMAVWYLACYHGTKYSAFIPLSGTFWGNIPESCEQGAVNLIHYHGKSDSVVPLEGRPIGSTFQGNVFKAFEMMTNYGNYETVSEVQSNDLECTRKFNSDRKILELCLYEGGHEMRVSQIKRALQEFDKN